METRLVLVLVRGAKFHSLKMVYKVYKVFKVYKVWRGFLSVSLYEPYELYKLYEPALSAYLDAGFFG